MTRSNPDYPSRLRLPIVSLNTWHSVQDDSDQVWVKEAFCADSEIRFGAICGSNHRGYPVFAKLRRINASVKERSDNQCQNYLTYRPDGLDGCFGYKTLAINLLR